MKILITGANGFIAQHLMYSLLNKSCHSIISTGRSNLSNILIEDSKFHVLDITNIIEVKKAIASYKPEVVIHLAALSLPNHCELNKEDCYNINVHGTENVIAVCKSINAYLLFAFTDFVFNGEKGPYKEDDKVDPVNYYGLSKVKAEELCMLSGLQFSIIRLCSVYGKSLSNKDRGVVMWVKESLGNKKSLKVFDDQVRTPTYVEDVVKSIIALAEKKLTGIYHIAGEETLTPYEMALKTADYLGLNRSLIEKVTSATFKEAAKRPLVTGLVIAKAKRDLQFQPLNFEQGLRKMFSGHE